MAYEHKRISKILYSQILSEIGICIILDDTFDELNHFIPNKYDKM